MSKNDSATVEPATEPPVRERAPKKSPDRFSRTEAAAPQAGLERAHIRAATAVFAASLVTYLITLAPSVTGEDSGELVAAAYTLGIPHPPGYPLWCIVTRIFMCLLPGTDVAWRANLASAVASAAGSGLLVLLLGRLGVRPLVAAGASMLMAVSSTLWGQSVITEVYGLNFLMMTLIMYCLVAWRQQTDAAAADRWMLWAALLCGLSLGVHQTILLASLPILLYVGVVGGDRLLSPMRVLKIILCVLAGLSIQLYLPLRAMSHPAMNWGHPDNWADFWAVVTRKQYSDDMAIMSPIRTMGATFAQLKVTAGYLLGQWLWPLTLVVLAGAAWGLAALWKRDKIVTAFLVLWGLTMSVVFTWLLNFRLDLQAMHAAEVFFIPAWLALVVFFGVGCESLAERFGTTQVGYGAIAVALVGLVGNFSASTMRGNDVALLYGRDLLATLPQNAIVFTSADYEAFPLKYLQIVEGVRPDVLALDDQREIAQALAAVGITPPASGEIRDADLALLMRNDKRPIYSTQAFVRVPETAVLPVGLLYRTFADARSAAEAGSLDEAAWKKYPPMPDGPWRNDWSTASILSAFDLAQARSTLAYHQDKLDTALEHVKRAAARMPNDALLLNSLGALLSNGGRREAAIEFYERAIVVNPTYKEAWFNKITTLIDIGRWDDAQEAYAKCGQAGVSFGEGSHQIENRLLAEKTARPQLQQMRDAARASPNNAELWLRFGAATLQLNHQDEALKAFQHAVEVAPTNAGAWAALGIVQARSGDRDAAVKSLRKSLQLQPKGKEADNVRASLRALGGKE